MSGAESTAELTNAEAGWLGLLQGLTEFLPVSSSGHLALGKYFLGLRDVPVFFDLMLHVGTLLAVLYYFRGLIWERLFPARTVAPPSDRPFVVLPIEPVPAKPRADVDRLSLTRLIALLVLGTLPVVLAVAAFPRTKPDRDRTWRNQVGDLRDDASRRPTMVLGFLGCTSLLLLASSRARSGTIDEPAMRGWQAFAIGCAQALSALCPGLSRSGMTISTSMLLGLRGDWAVRFSLLLSIPAILGATLLKLKELDRAWLTPPNLIATGIGTTIAAIVGFLSIGWLAGLVQRGRWGWFAPYLWLVIGVAGYFLSTAQGHG